MLPVVVVTSPCAWRVDWGSVPEWIGGVGTTLAFGGAVVTLALELRHRRRERADALHERRDAEAAQARLVTVHTVSDIKVIDGIKVVTGMRAAVVNDSTARVLAVSLFPPVRETFEMWTNPSTQQDEERPHRPAVHVRQSIAPGDTFRVAWEGTDSRLDSETMQIAGGLRYREPESSGLDSLLARVVFTDINGLEWERVGLHQPVRLLRKD